MATPKLLTASERKKQLAKLPDWSTNPKQTTLYRTYTFDSHLDALVFIARVTVHAEVLQHHPDIEFGYAKVKVKLTTHDVKGLSKLDIQLAQKIESVTRG